MNEKLMNYKEKINELWKERSKKQQVVIISAIVSIILALALVAFFSTRTNYEPLYSNLTLAETGQIKETLDARGVPSTVSESGTSILVPKDLVDTLKVELAAEGLPSSGTIDYSFIQDQMGFGMTDNEFNVMERASMQTELARLIRNMNGVNNANVMITLPEESVWLNAAQDSSTAAVVLDLAPGHQLDSSQVRALYHLVSRSVPNLPIDNIVISDQMFNDYYYEDQDNETQTTLTAFEQQRAIKNEIERDLTRNLHQMLGTMVGQDSVVVSVTTDIDFTQENRTEELVEPVDIDNIEGIAVSIERIEEAYSGEGFEEGGVEGTGDGIPNYPGALGQGPVDWERTEERINNEVNRINRDIVESPYKIRDLGIQVMVEPPEGLETLPQDQLNDIQQILGTIVRTSISSVYADELTEDEIEGKIVVSSHPFDGRVVMDQEPMMTISTWVYVVGGVLVALILLLLFIVMRNRRMREEDSVDESLATNAPFDLPDLPDEDTSEGAAKRRQLEKLAKEKPEDFSKLLRTWLSED
ncbi:flagellar basal-body MS-ring/collar protein FliF [Alkalihalobacillus hemicellulosilyticus]|uniref:Flagellar M-ring protein n=1 Tax=Halalkalibacter hemicellulosilyticusJCM 9152 TaxID=1236971 RepID=W4QB94_9BACI|nr:flagellar basal-body MS-ring/collar protein FliF [Halalkalibacter hemicellulosilyticus]GAE29242.1 flagellar M-ring protein FliF [Halalkalibacter hemicellulosilyticusJCM 9152]